MPTDSVGDENQPAGIKRASQPGPAPTHAQPFNKPAMSDNDVSSKNGASATPKGKKSTRGRARATKAKRGSTSSVSVSYRLPIRRVLAQVAPNVGTSEKAMNLLNAIANHFCKIILEETKRVSAYNKRATISPREIQTAVRIVIGGELAKHAVSDAAKAMRRSEESIAKQGC